MHLRKKSHIIYALFTVSVMGVKKPADAIQAFAVNVQALAPDPATQPKQIKDPYTEPRKDHQEKQSIFIEACKQTCASTKHKTASFVQAITDFANKYDVIYLATFVTASVFLWYLYASIDWSENYDDWRIFSNTSASDRSCDAFLHQNASNATANISDAASINTSHTVKAVAKHAFQALSCLSLNVLRNKWDAFVMGNCPKPVVRTSNASLIFNPSCYEGFDINAYESTTTAAKPTSTALTTAPASTVTAAQAPTTIQTPLPSTSYTMESLTNMLADLQQACFIDTQTRDFYSKIYQIVNERKLWEPKNPQHFQAYLQRLHVALHFPFYNQHTLANNQSTASQSTIPYLMQQAICSIEQNSFLQNSTDSDDGRLICEYQQFIIHLLQFLEPMLKPVSTALVTTETSLTNTLGTTLQTTLQTNSSTTTEITTNTTTTTTTTTTTQAPFKPWNILNDFNPSEHTSWVQVIANGASGSPAGRYGHGIVIDSNNVLWIFGGRGNLGNDFNDIFKYQINTKGPWIQVSANGASGSPIARTMHATVINSLGSIYIFGGTYTVAASGFSLNDLWKYPTSSMGPWQQVIANGAPGAPTARSGHAIVIGTDDTIWMFAGGGSSSSNLFNDLWKYKTSWIQINANGAPNTPAKRSGHAMAMGIDDIIWMFAGTDVAMNKLNDLWKFNTKTNGPWVQVKALVAIDSPSIRASHTMVINSLGMILMFGGYDLRNQRLNDIWIFNTNTSQPWKQVITNLAASSPNARAVHAIAIDSTGILWMFGGSSGYASNDLWQYNTTLSTQLFIASFSALKNITNPNKLVIANRAIGSPTGRFGHSMIIDSTNVIRIFGGHTGFLSNDLWLYNESSAIKWKELSNVNISSPSPRYEQAMIMNSEGIISLFGGTNGTLLNDFWIYNTSSAQGWILRSFTNTPSPRMSHSMAISSDKKIYLFGGLNQTNNVNNVLNDFWIYDDTSTQKWQQVLANGVSGSPAARYGHTIIIDSIGIIWLFGGRDLISLFNDLWKYSTSSTGPWEQVIANGASGSPAGRAIYAIAISSAGIIWLCGGRGNANLNDLWKYNTATSGPWQQIILNGVSGSPTARYGHKMVISSDDRLLVFGGRDDNFLFLNDLWTINTTDITPVQTQEFIQIAWEAAQTPYTVALYYDSNYGLDYQVNTVFNTSNNNITVPAPTKPGNHSITLQLLAYPDPSSAASKNITISLAEIT